MQAHTYRHSQTEAILRNQACGWRTPGLTQNGSHVQVLRATTMRFARFITSYQVSSCIHKNLFLY